MSTFRFSLATTLAGVCLVACGDAPVAPQPNDPPPSETVTLTAQTNLNQVVPDIVAADCTVLSAGDGPDTPVYLVPIDMAVQAHCSAQDRYPIMAPDNHQLTLSEWMTASGGVTVTCVGEGTRYEFALDGLIPNGVYTVWQFDETGAGALASHPGDTRNVFTAGPDGRADFTTLGTAGPMTFGGTSRS